MHQYRKKEIFLCIWCNNVGYFLLLFQKDDRANERRKWIERRNNRTVCCNEKYTRSFFFSFLTFQSGKNHFPLPRNKSGTNWQAAFVSVFSNERRMHKLRKLMRRFNILVTRVTNRMSSGKVLHVRLLLLLVLRRLRQLVVCKSLIKSRTECSKRWIEIANTSKLFLRLLA